MLRWPVQGRTAGGSVADGALLLRGCCVWQFTPRTLRENVPADATGTVSYPLMGNRGMGTCGGASQGAGQFLQAVFLQCKEISKSIPDSLPRNSMRGFGILLLGGAGRIAPCCRVG